MKKKICITVDEYLIGEIRRLFPYSSLSFSMQFIINYYIKSMEVLDNGKK